MSNESEILVPRRINIGRVAVALLSALVGITLAAGARAEAVTLECTWAGPPDTIMSSDQPTVDVDLRAGVVRGPHAVHRIDQVTDRYVYYGSYWRIDRKTGSIEGLNLQTHAFGLQYKCRRVEGNVIP